MNLGTANYTQHNLISFIAQNEKKTKSKNHLENHFTKSISQLTKFNCFPMKFV